MRLFRLIALLRGRPMPLSIHLTVGADKFDAEGEFTIAEAVPAITTWGRLIGEPPQQADVDALTDKLKANNDALQSVVTSTSTQSQE